MITQPHLRVHACKPCLHLRCARRDRNPARETRRRSSLCSAQRRGRRACVCRRATLPPVTPLLAARARAPVPRERLARECARKCRQDAHLANVSLSLCGAQESVAVHLRQRPASPLRAREGTRECICVERTLSLLMQQQCWRGAAAPRNWMAEAGRFITMWSKPCSGAHTD